MTSLLEPFDWEREYGPLFRACPSAFWLAPEPGDRRVDVIDVRPAVAHQWQNAWQNAALNTSLSQLAMMQQSQMSPYALGLANYRYSPRGAVLGGIL